MIVIYKITCLLTTNVYIGQTWNWKKRMNHYNTLHCSQQVKLYNSLKKYGLKNHKFEILENFDENITQEFLDTKEEYYINLYRTNFELLNIREAGSRGKLSKETIDKIKEKRKYFRHTEESKRKMRKPRPNMIGKAMKSIKCLNNNITYESVSKAALELGLKQGDISNVLTKRQNSTKGFKFEYNESRN